LEVTFSDYQAILKLELVEIQLTAEEQVGVQYVRKHQAEVFLLS
jgi:hypothetical protein